ncbi:MAG: SpoIIIAH-like family protein [Clostridia bacterium]|nr:SpoIIIAH-like family protein [Clostridia bacterium]
MKVFKRSQLAMLSIAFMIMIAGYINYKYDPKREESLGSTVRVDSKDVYLYTTNKNNVELYSENTETVLNKDANLYKDKEINSDEKSLSEFKITRDNMFSELEATYKEMVNVNVSSSEVKIYNEKLDELIKKKHLIEIVEGIIKAKGIEEIVIIPTEDTYNVMIKLNGELTKAQASMIEKIISEEFNVNAEKIRIILKK